MLHGLPGALLAAAVVLLPGYLIIPLVSGYRRLEGNGAVRGFGRGLIAASVGLMLASAIDIGLERAGLPGGVGVCALTLFLLHVLRWSPLLSLAAGSAAGLALVRLSPVRQRNHRPLYETLTATGPGSDVGGIAHAGELPGELQGAAARARRRTW